MHFENFFCEEFMREQKVFGEVENIFPLLSPRTNDSCFWIANNYNDLNFKVVTILKWSNGLECGNFIWCFLAFEKC